MAILGPFSVGFPVDFRSGGDTTKAAFGKHIQEIERIYGIINAIDSDKISASEFSSRLTAHMNDSNPHPNLSLSSLGGNIDISRITGNLAASRVSGALTNSTINADKVSNLSAFVQNLIPSTSIGDFRCDAYVNYCHGYATFNTGFENYVWQICFGRHPIEDYGDVDTNEKTIREHQFLRKFQTHCSVMVLTLADNDSAVSQHKNWTAMLKSHNASRFTYHIEANEGGSEANASNMEISYIAIGH